MKQHSPLTAEQQTLVEDHIPLVRWVVMNYFNRSEEIVGLELDDLCQEGAIALCQAAATYRPGKTAFSTYAVKVIRNYLLSVCRGITVKLRNLPTVSLDNPDYPEAIVEGCGEFETDSISAIGVQEILMKRKLFYQGAAKLGVDVLELKVMNGYGVTEIAGLYHAKPNLVGAWVSKATKRMREDLTEAELEQIGFEKYQKTA